MMDYEGFKAEITKRISAREGSGACVRIHRVRKNNGVMLEGLTIMKEGDNVSPAVYLEPFFERYLNGENIDFLAEEILGIYSTRSCAGRIDVGQFEDYKKLASGIRMRLVNYDLNRDMLQDVPHRKFLDLAGILYYDVRDPLFSNASVLIQNNYVKKWGVSSDELFETAERNMLLYEPAEIWPMGRMLSELRGMPEENSMSGFPLFVLTNKSRMFGAACMMYPGMFEQAALEMKSSFFVLPSSVHEVLLLSPENVFDGEGLRKLVREINENHVEPCEVLSDNVYYYDIEKRMIAMV